MKTIIAVPDFTRKAHLKTILPPLLKKLKGQDVEIIIATGLHRTPTKKEIKDNIGQPHNLAGCRTATCEVNVHNYRKRSVAYFGKTKTGVPIYLNKKLKNADSIITVGVVEPHLYAGYSGGTKVVAIGLAGEKTINATHHPRFLDKPGTRICSIKNNPFRRFIEEVSNLLPITYSINIVNTNPPKIFKGAPRASFKKATSYCKKIYEKKDNKKLGVIICDTPREKSINIYQASRTFNYTTNIKKNGIILVKADLKEGFGKGLGEKRFMKKMLNMKNPKKLIADIKKKGCLAGEHRAYMVAKAMLNARLGFISKNARLYKNKPLPFLFFKNMKEAQSFIRNRG
ncbi:lactate racemase domain-containing protein [Candidatus Omnitrophota bacterium]